MYESAEDYMKSIREIKTSINNKRRELEELKDIITVSSTTYNVDKIKSQTKRDKFEEKIIKNMERRESLQEKVEDEITEMLEWQDTAVSLINMIESDDQKEVLMLRYIDGKNWAEIMDIRGCDDLRNQYRLHQRALDSLQKIIDRHLIATTKRGNM